MKENDNNKGGKLLLIKVLIKISKGVFLWKMANIRDSNWEENKKY